jgi:hypothetical protein
MGVLFFLLGCGGSEPAPPPAAVEAPVEKEPVAPPAPKGISLSEKESELLKPYIEDIRQGVRLWNEQGIGICKGQSKDCEEFLGSDAGELAEGSYMIRAELQAPKIAPSDKWRATFTVDCEITKQTKNGETSTDKSYKKEYKITHSSREDHGYRLSPLYKISSPSPYGKQSCKFKMTAHNVDGDVDFTGSWQVPAKEK